jgi:hypothetical protein
MKTITNMIDSNTTNENDVAIDPSAIESLAMPILEMIAGGGAIDNLN